MGEAAVVLDAPCITRLAGKRNDPSVHESLFAMPSWCFDRATEHTCLSVLPLQNHRRLPQHLVIAAKPLYARREFYRSACTTVWQEELADLASKICTQEVNILVPTNTSCHLKS